MLNIINTTTNNQNKNLNDIAYLEHCLQSFSLWHSAKTISGIRSNTGVYLVATDAYAKLLGITDAATLSGKTDTALCHDLIDFAKSTAQQDAEVLATQKITKFLEIHNYAAGLNVYSFRREPMINPNTRNIVAIRFFAEPFCLHISRRMFSAIYKPKEESANNFIIENLSKSCKLGNLQFEIIFYSLLGFNSNKELSLAMSSTIKPAVPTRVRAALHSLSTKFGISGVETMLWVVRALGFDKYMPATALRLGSFRMNEDFVILDNKDSKFVQLG